MLKNTAMAAAIALLPLAEPALAQTEIPQQIISQLRDQGFREIRVSRTFLGRTRIVATNAEFRREIVINPVTGLILRDYWVLLSGDDEGGGGAIVNPRAGSGEGGGVGDDDDNDDDDDDDDDDD